MTRLNIPTIWALLWFKLMGTAPKNPQITIDRLKYTHLTHFSDSSFEPDLTVGINQSWSLMNQFVSSFLICYWADSAKHPAHVDEQFRCAQHESLEHILGFAQYQDETGKQHLNLPQQQIKQYGYFHGFIWPLWRSRVYSTKLSLSCLFFFFNCTVKGLRWPTITKTGFLP